MYNKCLDYLLCIYLSKPQSPSIICVSYLRVSIHSVIHFLHIILDSLLLLFPLQIRLSLSQYTRSYYIFLDRFICKKSI